MNKNINKIMATKINMAVVVNIKEEVVKVTINRMNESHTRTKNMMIMKEEVEVKIMKEKNKVVVVVDTIRNREVMTNKSNIKRVVIDMINSHKKSITKKKRMNKRKEEDSKLMLRSFIQMNLHKNNRVEGIIIKDKVVVKDIEINKINIIKINTMIINIKEEVDKEEVEDEDINKEVDILIVEDIMVVKVLDEDKAEGTVIKMNKKV